MPPRTTRAPSRATKPKAHPPIQHDADAVVTSLKRLASRATRDGMARYAIPSHNAFGVPMAAMQKLAKQSRGPDASRNHQLAAALWATGWYEARTVAAFVDDPASVTPAQMDRWCRDFDSWAICDTACFHLFDRTPHAFQKVSQWSARPHEFVRRAAFALLASLALHDKAAPDESFAGCLPLIERAATDERNFVKKGVSWALRAIGRRNAALKAAALATATRLAASPDATARWVGKDALRDLSRPATIRAPKTRRSAPAR